MSLSKFLKEESDRLSDKAEKLRVERLYLKWSALEELAEYAELRADAAYKEWMNAL